MPTLPLCRWTPPRVVLCGVLCLSVGLLTGCGATPGVQAVSPTVVPPADSTPSTARRLVRATGIIQAVRAFAVQVPQVTGQNGRLTLVRLAEGGKRVAQGDVLAEFDRTPQTDAAREAESKYEDLSHQVRQKEAQNRSDAEKRSADLKQAEADLAKAGIQLQKGPVLSEIDRQKNEVKAESGRARVASLQRIDAARQRAEQAALHILELKRDRQKVALERATRNAERLVVKAPIAGMVALDNMWRNGSMGHAQEGDQLWPGQTMLRIFDPGEMEVRTMIGEPDGVVLKPGTTARVYLDAYSDAVFPAEFHSASPVATAALGSPIKNFTARFRIRADDPRLLPDLSAAVILELDNPLVAENRAERKQP